MRILMFVVAMLIAGCEKKPAATGDPAQRATGTALGAGSGTASGPTAGVAAHPPAAGSGFLPAAIPDNQALAFASAKGGTVTAEGGVSIPDGTRLQVVSVNEVDMSNGGDPSVNVEHAGKTVKLPIASVLQERSLQRSPDGRFAIVSYITGCGDACHTALLVLDRDGRRTLLGDGLIDVVVAWRKDGKEVAVGSGSLWLISLPDLGVRRLEDYTAPAYAPDGTLYVRDHDGSVFTLAGVKAKRVYKAKPDPEPMEGDHSSDPPPITFDAAGKPVFE